MLPYIQHHTSRDEHIIIRTVQTDVTFVWKKKLRYYKEIRLTLSTKEPKLYQNADKKPSKPKKLQPNETTFSSNRLIAVT